MFCHFVANIILYFAFFVKEYLFGDHRGLNLKNSFDTFSLVRFLKGGIDFLEGIDFDQLVKREQAFTIIIQQLWYKEFWDCVSLNNTDILLFILSLKRRTAVHFNSSSNHRLIYFCTVIFVQGHESAY